MPKRKKKGSLHDSKTVHSAKVRSWFFTWNNYTEESENWLKTLYTTNLAKAILYGREVGSENGTPHLQGVVTLKNPQRLSWLRKQLASSGFAGNVQPNWSPTKFERAAELYCQKEGDVVTYGDNEAKPGQRTDLEQGCRSLVEHRDLQRFKLEFPTLWVKYPRGFSTLLEQKPRDRNEPPYVEWIYGPTATGKTRSVYERHEVLWPSNGTLQWFDGYQGQEVVLFDDFRGHHCSFTLLLRYLDRYPLKVPIKGGYVEWVPKKIYITSCKHPKDCYQKEPEDIEQLLRRITTIKFTGEVHSAIKTI